MYSEGSLLDLLVGKVLEYFGFYVAPQVSSQDVVSNFAFMATSSWELRQADLAVVK